MCCGLARGTARLDAPGLGGKGRLFEHPTSVFSSCFTQVGRRSSCCVKLIFPKQLAAGNLFLTVCLVQIIEDVVGFRQYDVPILQDRNIVLA